MDWARLKGLTPKPVLWTGSSRTDLSAFPPKVRYRVGGALWDAQIGEKSPAAKPLKGFGGAGVLEVVDDFDGDTYRAVYTVRFAGAIYVLHAFQKKSRSGIATLQSDIDLIRRRLAQAEVEYEQWRGSQESSSKKSR
jgi:phage-related protein